MELGRSHNEGNTIIRKKCAIVHSSKVKNSTTSVKKVPGGSYLSASGVVKRLE